MNSLRPSERSRYLQLKKQMQDGLMQVAEALYEIRECKLYIDEYKTFGDFIENECDYSRPRVYQMIKAVEGQRKLSTIVDKRDPDLSTIVDKNESVNVSVAVEIASIPEQHIPEVIEQATEGGSKPITAAAVKRVKGEIVNDGLSKRDREIEQFRKLRSTSLQHNAAMMRSIDSMNDLRMNPGSHRKLIQMFEKIDEILRAWPE